VNLGASVVTLSEAGIAILEDKEETWQDI